MLADPPWQERGAGRIRRGADRHYPLLNARDIVDAIRGSGFFRPTPHAHLWLWVTDNHLREGLWVMERLAFRYVRTCAWFKDDGRIGIGQYLRGKHELMLFGVLGSGKDPSVWTGNRDVPSAFMAPRQRHSEKPDESYRLIERVSKGPRIEFFARASRPGWMAWGNELPADQAAE